jgi:hypothetical protein
MQKTRASTEDRYRSLLQKAVRRGNIELVLTTSALLDSLSSKERNWYRTRAAIIAFEDCWPLGTELAFNKKFHSKVAAMIRVSCSEKTKDATGLGYLGYALFEGDRSVLGATPEERPLNIIASAIQRPSNYWQWLLSQKTGGKAKTLIENAYHYRNAGHPRDRAVVQAAAYLALSTEIPTVKELKPASDKFPFWVAFDMHTAEGRRVMRDVTRDLHLPRQQLEWTYFYFEGAVTNGDMPSMWWDRYCRWYFRKIGLPIDEAHLVWQPVKDQVIDALSEESRRLHGDLYRWKLEHRERVESLRRQVGLYIEHFDNLHTDQLALFEKEESPWGDPATKGR